MDDEKDVLDGDEELGDPLDDELEGDEFDDESDDLEDEEIA